MPTSTPSLTAFPYWIERRPDGYRAHFPNYPEFEPLAPTIQALVENLQAGFLPILEARLKNDNLPEPLAPCAGENILQLTPTYATKLHLILAIKAQRFSTGELCKRIGCLPQEATRIMKLTHPTKIDTLASAISVLGGKIECQIDFK